MQYLIDNHGLEAVILMENPEGALNIHSFFVPRAFVPVPFHNHIASKTSHLD